MSDYAQTLERLVSIIKNRRHDDTMAALIIDSPWLPGYAGVGTIDFYFDSAVWLEAYARALHDLPGAAFIPGSWVELGMAAEPSGWGVPIQWSNHQPPGLNHHPADLETLAAAPVPNPETDGMMPVLLRQYERMKQPLHQLGIPPRMAAAWELLQEKGFGRAQAARAFRVGDRMERAIAAMQAVVAEKLRLFGSVGKA